MTIRVGDSVAFILNNNRYTGVVVHKNEDTCHIKYQWEAVQCKRQEPRSPYSPSEPGFGLLYERVSGIDIAYNIPLKNVTHLFK